MDGHPGAQLLQVTDCRGHREDTCQLFLVQLSCLTLRPLIIYKVSNTTPATGLGALNLSKLYVNLKNEVLDWNML